MKISKFSYFKQHDSMDCGPACLRMIFNYYGCHVDYRELNEKTDVSNGGVTLLSISETSEEFGFESASARFSLTQLVDDIRLPAILLWDQFHFVVLYKIANNAYYIADPAVGKIKLQKKEFIKHWISDKSEDKGIALLLQPGEDFVALPRKKKSVVRGIGWTLLYAHIWKYRRYFLQIIIGLIIGSIFQLILPFLTQNLVDIGIKQNNISFIYLIIIGQSVLFLGRILIEFIRSRLLLFISSHINITILSDFWIKLLRLPISFFQVRQTGDIIQRVGDHQRLEQFLTGGTINTLFSLTNLLIFSVVIYSYSFKIFVVFIIANILYLSWIMLFIPYRRALDYRRFSISSRENSATMQMIFGIQDIKLSNSEQLRRLEWESLQSAIFNLSFTGLTLTQIQQAGSSIINEGKNIIITLFVAKAVINGSITLGTMLAIQYIVGQLSSPVEQLLLFFQQAQDAKISLARLNEIHILKDEEPENKVFTKSFENNRGIFFKNVKFAYPGSGQFMTLKNISFVVPSGNVTAIVGMSGSGKTTLLKLLMQFYLNYQGDIFIGDCNLKNISPSFWRSKCGCVMQDGYIFNDSIETNIAIDFRTIDQEKMIRVCEIANIYNFIKALPLGFKTKIGNEGHGLSQGQKQRILIARAIYKDPEFIFFDEATNALDSNNEKSISKNLSKVFLGKTVIVIAHRLSTIIDADNIVVLHEGEIAETGNHKALIEKKGIYYELVKNQNNIM